MKNRPAAQDSGEVIFFMILTQKETMLLQDLKTQEQVCIEKYNQYAERANDPKLSQLLRTISSAEQQHLSTLEQMEKGTVPAMGGGQKQPFQPPASAPASAVSPQGKQQDAYLCQDLLATEKHVSSVYNTGIFEFKDVGMRDALNHIQKEEQEHGKKLYDKMSQNGMY